MAALSIALAGGAAAGAPHLMRLAKSGDKSVTSQVASAQTACASMTSLDVAVPPALFAATQEAADEASDRKGGCITYRLRPVTAALAAQRGGTGGAGGAPAQPAAAATSAAPPAGAPATGAAPAPGAAAAAQEPVVGAVDAWFTDSEAWVPAAERNRVSRPVAYSPVVLAVPQGVGASGQLTPQQVGMLAQGPMRFAEPAESTPSLLSLLALRQSSDPTVGEAVRALSRRTVSESELESSLTAPPTQALVFPSTEQRIAQLAKQTGRQITAASLPGAVPMESYSLVTRTQDPARVAALDALVEAFAGDTVRKSLVDQGFRTAPQAAPAGAAPVTGVPASLAPPAPVDPGKIAGTMDAWAGARRDGRYVIAVDTSGSMQAAAEGGKRRIELATGALAVALRSVPVTSEVGLWSFAAARSQGGQDWKELVPMGSLELPATRDALAKAGATLVDPATPPRGGTGLYDTTVAAYQTVRDRSDAKHEGIALILTDGKNDDDSGGRTIEQAIADLGRLQDPARPVRLVLVGVGEEPDKATLDRLAASVGGLSYTSETVEALGQILPKALTLQLTDGTK
ncbi:VWA domain-containing protein [Arsenicicoccus dermatophilus]|uniref:VWA domain-containing protein n=1 Tax=Arsenicicoccus dermatophilus TaxID=1076331 RepID=UPI001F4D12CF|nr:VWA domain-containing protein [Arsenicicoccus dermatophilus]MCH8613261.1 VWA domain-containing protein [Arsenicicoccus dermatophilus]